MTSFESHERHAKHQDSIINQSHVKSKVKVFLTKLPLPGSRGQSSWLNFKSVVQWCIYICNVSKAVWLKSTQFREQDSPYCASNKQIHSMAASYLSLTRCSLSVCRGTGPTRMKPSSLTSNLRLTKPVQHSTKIDICPIKNKFLSSQVRIQI